MLTLLDLARRANARNVFNATVSNSAATYSSGQVIGSILTIDTSAGVVGPNEESGLSSVLQSLSLIDPNSQNSAIDLFFFSKRPASAVTDAATFAPSLVDLKSCLGVVQIVTGDYASGGALGSVAGTAKQANLGHVLKCEEASGTAIYCVAVSRGTPTYTGIGLFLKFQFSQGL